MKEAVQVKKITVEKTNSNKTDNDCPILSLTFKRQRLKRASKSLASNLNQFEKIISLRRLLVYADDWLRR